MVAPINVKIVGDSIGLQTALSDATRHVELFGGKVGADLPGWAGVAVDATKRIGEAVFNSGKAAKDAAAEEQIFSDAMHTLGVTSGEQEQAIRDSIAAAQDLAFSDSEAAKALLSLQTATKDTNATLDLFAIAQDIARVAGVDLGTAADAVAKAAAGEELSLKRMLPGLGETSDAHDAITKAAELAAGAADTYGTSSEASAIKAKNAFGELKEQVGAELGPALKDLWDSLQPIISDLLHLAGVVLPPVIDGISKVAEVVGKAFDVIGNFIDAIQRLMDKLRDLLGPIQDAIDKLGQIDLNPFNRANGIIGGRTIETQTATGRDVGAGNARTRGGEGGVVINVYGDPAVIESKITKALRDYTRRNGTGTVFAPGRS